MSLLDGTCAVLVKFSRKIPGPYVNGVFLIFLIITDILYDFNVVKDDDGSTSRLRSQIIVHRKLTRPCSANNPLDE